MSNNYQLYRTNRRLTGQVKWDLTVEAHDSHLYVNDLHLSPISKQISIVKNPDENLLGNTHLVNLKSYYLENKAIFWNPGLNPMMSSCEPVLVRDDYGDGDHKSLNITPYEESYMTGLSRSKYSYTGKQFEFFCPVWIEDYNPETPLAFKFVLKLASGNNSKIMQELVTKFLILQPGEYSNHNKFINYLKDYFNITKSDDLININLKERTAQIKGIDIENGLPVSSIEIPSLATNMLSQERLLMDADELIISSFERNNLIVPQLINFNFVFDAEELITPSLLTAMWGGNIYIDVCAGVMKNGVTFKQFDMMDFYSNYDFIRSKPSGLEIADDDGYNINIFDALKDYRNIDLMDKNKVSQDIIHWSINGCNDYIFNMYPGFGGYTINNIINTEKRPSITGSFNGDLYNAKSDLFYGVGEDLTIKRISWSHLKAYEDFIGNLYKWDNNPQCYIAKYGKLKGIKDIKFDDYPDIKDDELVIIKPGLSGRFTMYYAGSSEKCIGRITELYQDSPDLWVKKYKYAPTCINWCKNLYINSPVVLEKYFDRMILDTNEYSYLFNEWSCNTKYTYISDKFKPNRVKGCLIVLPDMIFNSVGKCKTVGFDPLGIINDWVQVYYNELDDIVLFFVDEEHLDAAAFRAIHDWAFNYNDDKFLGEFARWISSVEEPGAYALKQLGYTQAHGPSKIISELEHYKVNQISTIFRYDGNIKPTFVKPDVNNIYIKRLLKMTDILKQFPKTYQPYKKLYKSIGYYPWESVNLKLNETNQRDIILNLPDMHMPYEYKWYTTSTVLLLRSQLSFNINSDDITNDIKTTVINYLSRIYKVNIDTANYIYKKYDCQVDWEYQNNTSLNKYIYTITLKLK